jgi:hypothetical protein
VPPVAGAALLGLDEVQAGPDAHARLRAAYPADAGTRPAGGQPALPPVRAGGVREVAPGQALA